ncbi:acyl-CoA dehydrogenase [Sphingosinicella microcystinivorans]|uniref:3-methylmercaptopropionyl-CoA dehydrogenase n=1 Tax=Sphingosinicella microcystinivorans TaxID=335406 RepID=A0AAD1D587_SPHMI|nr:acyl-CoA dehydrogenase [Sphingosinicella microcystinivorans]RKS90780.1 alkylation response protein AidB-like acyl-CoA dehydrogenase [Sphingosinicella microcystinivorans]BBE33694.1 acyl-CoA dehydrogenase [Sphingosinicella microcystinivorans]
MTYTAPITEQRFVLETIADLPGLAQLPRFEAATADLVDAILEEAGKLSAGVFAPLNRIGDTEGAKLANGVVTLPAGFREAYAAYVEGGWMTLGADPAWGGQGLPFALATAVQEQTTSANMALSLCPMLSQGAIEALTAHGSEDQKQTYLTKIISGEWTGTMNLTEPQAGTDVGALRTVATPAEDGTWRIKGSKIFITWGEHDVADNIIHLVLARTPGSPKGTKGISLFIVPKFLVNADGSLGARNDLRCVSIEHKLGIHSSPTCTMSYGDNDDCVGYMIGGENAGMRAMFTMMNHARINVGLQGVSIAERAYQHALAYAKERVQVRRIIEFPDVRRMLMTMRGLTEAARALTYLNAAAVDRAHAEVDELARREAQALADLLTPVTKAFSTDIGVEVASLGVQIFGGMGFIEETGAAQHYRDARIAPIYEGTNGIQAMDLVGRKLPQARWKSLFSDMRADFALLLGETAGLAPYLEDALAALESATTWLAEGSGDDNAAGATPYLRMFGLTVGGWLLAKQASAATQRLNAGEGDPAFLKAKIVTARFFAEQFLPQAAALLGPVTRGAETLFAIPDESL